MRGPAENAFVTHGQTDVRQRQVLSPKTVRSIWTLQRGVCSLDPAQSVRWSASNFARHDLVNVVHLRTSVRQH